MSKFPLLKAYRIAAIVLAVIVIILGIGAAGTAGSVSGAIGRNFDLSAFLVTLLPFLGGAFALGVIAELILLALRIEDHLDHLRQASERPITQALAPESPAPEPSPTLHAALSRSASAEPQSPNDQIAATIHVGRALIRKRPNLEAAPASEVRNGHMVILHGRSADGKWVTYGRAQANPSGLMWLQTSDLLLDGDVMTLPVIEGT